MREKDFLTFWLLRTLLGVVATFPIMPVCLSSVGNINKVYVLWGEHSLFCIWVNNWNLKKVSSKYSVVCWRFQTFCKFIYDLFYNYRLRELLAVDGIFVFVKPGGYCEACQWRIFYVCNKIQHYNLHQTQIREQWKMLLCKRNLKSHYWWSIYGRVYTTRKWSCCRISG